jgi:phage I-like protein
LKEERLKKAIQLLTLQADEGKVKKIAEKSAAIKVNISTLENSRDEAQKELDDYVATWRSETDAAKNKLELIKRFSPDDNRESRAFTNSPDVDHMSCDPGLRLTTES